MAAAAAVPVPAAALPTVAISLDPATDAEESGGGSAADARLTGGGGGGAMSLERMALAEEAMRQLERALAVETADDEGALGGDGEGGGGGGGDAPSGAAAGVAGGASGGASLPGADEDDETSHLLAEVAGACEGAALGGADDGGAADDLDLFGAGPFLALCDGDFLRSI